MSLNGSNDYERLQDLVSRKYADQAVWFLNSYWNSWGEENAEKLWSYVEKNAELDLQHGKDGCALDEMMAHRFLEVFDETLTVRELRNKLRDSQALKEKERPKTVPLSHFLIFKYDCDWNYLVNASQGDNQEQVEQAKAMLDAVQKALNDAQAAADEAKAREEDAKKAENASKQAQKELEAALAELHAQEEAYNNKTETLKKKSEEGGVVSRNRAKAELEIHLAEDPLPLRRAKIDQGAAVRKAEKATIAAEQATAAAVAAREASEAAVDEARARVEEAEAYLQEVKNQPGSAEGQMWVRF
eukprot:TRINITY_DN87_c0_g2_i2.p1 TRINITY_DN87_c0_g2~~TRINITY_DN87_c0_g2_i2.p1  ORF type:complete len:301 (-),score=176.41 TRINITY_DN87_c0_g2_i2:331-1233(-)